MNNIDKAYTALLQDIIDNGVEKKDRTGTGTISVFGRQIRHKMSEGFPLLTTKKMAFKTMVTELIWFLRGDTNIKYLVDNNCHIWDGDAYKNYTKKYENTIKEQFESLGIQESNNLDWAKSNPPLTQEEFINKIKTDDEFAKQWGELGPIYGKQWRSWGDGGFSTWTDVNDVVRHKHRTEYPQIDQIQNLINDLKTNPDSRRMMVSAWNVGELDQMVLPPCHYGFQVYTRELSDEERLSWMKQNRPKTVLPMRDPNVEFSMDEFFRPYGVPKRAISLMWNQRSVDTFLGLPFNIASYGLLLMMLADEVNMVPDELIGNLGDVHLYSNHVEQAKEQICREPFELPTVHVRDGIYCSSVNDVILENYQSHPAIKAPLSN
jgi:thymidylate synthase